MTKNPKLSHNPLFTGISYALDRSEDGMPILDAPSKIESNEDPFPEDFDEDNLPPPDSSSDEEVATATVKPKNWLETPNVVETDRDLYLQN